MEFAFFFFFLRRKWEADHKKWASCPSIEDRISKSKLVAWAWTLWDPSNSGNLWHIKLAKPLGKYCHQIIFEVAFIMRLLRYFICLKIKLGVNS